MNSKLKLSGYVKLSVLFLLIAGVVLACKKDDDDNTPEEGVPVITLVSPSSGSVTLTVGDTLAIAFNASADAGTGAELAFFRLTSQFNQETVDTLITDSISGVSYSFPEYEVPIHDEGGTQLFTIFISDNAGKSASLVITVTIQEQNAFPPAISFKTNSGFIFNDTTLETNTPISFGVVASPNATTGSPMVTFKVRRKYEATPALPVFDTSFNSLSFEWEGSSVAYPNVGSEIWTFRVDDEQGMYGVVSFKITTEAGGPGMVYYQNIQIGSTSGTIPQGVQLTTGETFKLQELTSLEDRQKVDLVYFNNETFGHTVVSPKHNTAASVYGTTIGNWTDPSRRITYISKKANLSGSDFDVISMLSQLIVTISVNGGVGTQQIYSSENSFPGGFEVDDIFAVETQAGNVGLMKITEVNEGSSPETSNIKFELKIEE